MQITRALILAAGRGKRLMPFTKAVPKCLVRVGDHPILFYQLRALEKCGIREIFIVIGYRGEAIKQYVAAHFPKLNFRFVENTRHSTTNDIYSLYLARKNFDGGFLLLDSDVLFHPQILPLLFYQARGKSAVCFSRNPCGEEEMKVVMGENGYLQKISKNLDPQKVNGESAGISIFNLGELDHLTAALEEIVGHGGWYLYREAAFEKIISENGVRLLGVDTTEYPSMEIDYPEDLKRAEEEILSRIISEFK